MKENSNGTNGNGVADRSTNGRFLRGHRVRTGGRPPGARNKLNERFLADLQKVWLKSGRKCLEKMAQEEPTQLAKIVASLLPRQLLTAATVDVAVDHFAGARTRLEMYRIARDFIADPADDVPLIEARPLTDDDDGQSGND